MKSFNTAAVVLKCTTVREYIETEHSQGNEHGTVTPPLPVAHAVKQRQAHQRYGEKLVKRLHYLHGEDSGGVVDYEQPAGYAVYPEHGRDGLRILFAGDRGDGYFTDSAMTSDAITEIPDITVLITESLNPLFWLYLEFDCLMSLGATYTTSFCFSTK